MTFGNWYRSKYPFIASEEEYARLISAFEAGQANPPDGYKLVPIEPTKKMVRASFDCAGVTSPDDYRRRQYISIAWHAMLAAAPTPGKDKE